MPSPDQLVQMAAQALARNQRDQARQMLESALSQSPAHPAANQYLGLILAQSGDLPGAIRAFEAALRAAPNNPALIGNLAMLKSGAGDQDAAAALFHHALTLNPSLPDAHACLGIMRATQQRAADAEVHFLAALKSAPNRPDVVYAYTRMLTETGRAEEAVAIIRNAQRASPADLLLQDKLCMMLNYVAGVAPEQLFQEHVRYGQLAPRPDGDFTGVDRSPERPLRIGYISADLREHSVAYFLEPLLEHRSRRDFQVYCYHLGAPDETVTPRLRALADAWRPLFPCTDDQLLDAVASDQIDIAVDLAGHTSGNRLSAFARRAAPVQFTYIGYPNTTGLSTMEWRIIDSTTDPAGADDLATERLIRLDPCFLCYRPPAETSCPPDPSTRPAAPITFASFNSLAKLSPPTIALWSRILAAVPGSRLMLKGKALSDPSVADRFRARFAAHAIAADRLELLGHTPTTADHLANYQRVHIALDPFPYAGTTTTCEALFMGVPVVTLRGERHSGRVGASLLSAVGLPELIADTEDDYVRSAVALAADPTRLRVYHASIRQRLLASLLCDGTAFVRRYEAAVRQMWRSACAPQ